MTDHQVGRLSVSLMAYLALRYSLQQSKTLVGVCQAVMHVFARKGKGGMGQRGLPGPCSPLEQKRQKRVAHSH